MSLPTTGGLLFGTERPSVGVSRGPFNRRRLLGCRLRARLLAAVALVLQNPQPCRRRSAELAKIANILQEVRHLLLRLLIVLDHQAVGFGSEFGDGLATLPLP